MPTTEIIDGILRIPGFCSCGLEMEHLAGGIDMCRNCDGVQPQEISCADWCKPGLKSDKEHGNPGKRVGTDRDYAFMKVWRQRILKLYPGDRP